MEIPTTPFAFVTLAALSLLAVLWGMVRAQNTEQGARITKLEAQNIEQQKDITRLQTQMVAREDAHEAAREAHAQAVMALRIDTNEKLRTIDSKLDKLLGLGPRRETPSPGRYGEKT